MARGGRRDGAGRREGSKNKTTLEKEAANELVRTLVTAELEPLVMAPVSRKRKATICEAFGDAIVRIAIHHPLMSTRVALFLLGAVLLTLYGTSLNLAPVEFATVTGMYVATLFVVFQITNFIFFSAAPTPPIWLGGGLIVAGGVVISVWK